MTEIIITTIVSSVFTLAGVVITVLASSRKNRIISDMKQEMIEERLSELSARVDEHNNYAIEIPLIQKDISYIREQLKHVDL